VHLVKRFIHVVQRRVLPHDEQAAQHLAQLNQSMAEVAPAAAWALDGSAATTASSGSRLPNTRTRGERCFFRGAFLFVSLMGASLSAAATLDLNSSSSGASSAGVGAKMLLREARAWLKSLEQKVPYVFVPEARSHSRMALLRAALIMLACLLACLLACFLVCLLSFLLSFYLSVLTMQLSRR
jgi:hypothetical protein